jgi:serine/threonine-protein kinase TTK/MPS1
MAAVDEVPHAALGSRSAASSAKAVMSALMRRLRRAKQDVPQIQAVVRDAERDLADQASLCDVYQVAMQAIGPAPFKAAPDAYEDLCLKRLQALAVSRPAEALEFHEFLAYYGILQQDARVRIARSEAEARVSGRLVDEQDSDGTPLRPRTLRYSGCDSAPGSAEATPREASEPASGTGSGAATAPAFNDRRAYPSTSLGGRTQRRSSTLDSRRASMLSENLSPIPEAPPDSLDQSFLSNEGLAVAVARQRPTGDRFGRQVDSWPAEPPGLAPPPEEEKEEGEEREPAAADADPFRRPADEHEETSVATLIDDPSGGASDESRAEAPESPEPAPGGAAAAPGGPAGVLPAAASGALPAGTAAEAADFSDSSALGGLPTSEACVGDGPKPPKTVVVNGVPYTRLQTIGRGGSSKVYQVQAPSGETLALKRVHASSPAHLEQLANEVALLQRLRNSPNVIRMVDAEVVRERNLIHIVMEQGEMDLGNYLQSDSDRDISLGDVQWLWKGMLEAVQAVHQERIVHTDLKPANFLLAGGRWKLIDFGIAKRIQSETTHISRENLLGTITYMAPESINGGCAKIGRPADIWSLGIILYQIVYGHAPFAHLDPTQRLLRLSDPNVAVEFPPGHRFEGHSDATKASILDVLRRCLHRDPRKRAQIPELLEHGFLRQTIQLSRRCFDRAIESLVANFFTVARTAIFQDNAEDAGEAYVGEEDEEAAKLAAQQDCCQRLSDEVWDHVSRGYDTEDLRLESAELPGLEHFRDKLHYWLARGVKRQRISAPPEAAFATSGAPEPQVRVEKAAPAPPPPQPSSSRWREGAAAAPTGGGLAPRGFAPQKGASASTAAAPPIPADMLNLQLSRLKKTATSGPSSDFNNKENKRTGPAGPKKAAAAPAPLDGSKNLVLQRLKDRRALVADDRTNEEVTQPTQTHWIY